MDDLSLTRRAVALALTAFDPHAANVIYILAEDSRSQAALRAVLEENPPSAICIRRALTLASEDPELSLLQNELTAAIPQFVDEAKKENCDLLAMQLGLTF